MPGIKKKLVAKGKKKVCEDLGLWAKAVSHHVYWSAKSSQGVADLVRAKWLSILNHTVNIHEGHGSLFPSCAHAALEDAEQREWLVKGK